MVEGVRRIWWVGFVVIEIFVVPFIVISRFERMSEEFDVVEIFVIFGGEYANDALQIMSIKYAFGRQCCVSSVD